MQRALDKSQTYTRSTTKTAAVTLRNAAIRKWLLTLLMLVLVLILDYPIFAIFLNGFRTTAEILSTTSIIPQHPTLANFAYLSARTNFWGFFISSLIVAGLGTVISIICAGAAGYTLSRYHKLRSVSNYSRALMLVQMFPLDSDPDPLVHHLQRCGTGQYLLVGHSGLHGAQFALCDLDVRGLL